MEKLPAANSAGKRHTCRFVEHRETIFNPLHNLSVADRQAGKWMPIPNLVTREPISSSYEIQADSEI